MSEEERIKESEIIFRFTMIINKLYLNGFIKDIDGHVSVVLKQVHCLYFKEKSKNEILQNKILDKINEIKRKIEYHQERKQLFEETEKLQEQMELLQELIEENENHIPHIN